MRLTYPNVASEIRELAYRALNLELVRLPHPEHGAATARHEASAHVPSFHKVFLLPVRVAARAIDLRRARHVSWYDILIVSGVAVAVEVTAGTEKTVPCMYVLRGLQIDSQIAILTALAHDSADQAGEVRILRIPPIAPLNIWLHGRRKSEDRIIPVVITSNTLKVGNAYEPGAFLDAIRATAAHLADGVTPKPAPQKARAAKPRRRKAGGKP
jgi:hypothetical protein